MLSKQRQRGFNVSAKIHADKRRCGLAVWTGRQELKRPTSCCMANVRSELRHSPRAGAQLSRGRTGSRRSHPETRLDRVKEKRPRIFDISRPFVFILTIID